MKKYDIDYVVHGDEPCLVNGEDVYVLPHSSCFLSLSLCLSGLSCLLIRCICVGLFNLYRYAHAKKIGASVRS